MKSILKDYLAFSKGQQRGILALLFLIAIVGILYYLLPTLIHSKTTSKKFELDSIMSQIRFDTNISAHPWAQQQSNEPMMLTPFNFDPNTLDYAGFIQLGLREKLVATLLNYRNKGGRFYNKESLKRIYGLHDEEYKQLEPFIQIPSGNKNSFQLKLKENFSVELNNADSNQLIALKGIGSKLSMNIISFRERMGGFARIEQIKEVFGISEETYTQIKSSLHVNLSLIKTINLNTATLFELNAHPYLHGNIARALVEYRKVHNYKIENLDQIKEIPLINDEIFRKIVPYLRIQ